MTSETPTTPLLIRLTRVREQVESWNSFDVQEDRDKAAELLFVEFCIELVSEPYLTEAGLERVEERTAWTEALIAENATDSDGEA